MDGKIEIQYLPIADLKAAPYNPNELSDEKKKQLALSMGRFGTVEPIVVNKDGTIIGGHNRIAELEARGETEAPCIIRELDKLDEMRLNLALNNIHGEADRGKLKVVLEEVDIDDTPIEVTGISEIECEEIMTAAPPENIANEKETHTIQLCFLKEEAAVFQEALHKNRIDNNEEMNEKWRERCVFRLLKLTI